MKRTFVFTTGMDISVSIEVDLDVLTVAMATEINDFWSSSEEVLEASDDDVIVAAARRAASRLMGFLLEGHDDERAIAELCKCEGWPPVELLGMTIVDSEIPDFDPVYLDFEERESEVMG